MPPRKRAGDMTGLETQRLQEEHAAELKLRAKEIALMADVEAEEFDTPVDYSNGPDTALAKNQVEVEEVKLESPTRVVIPNTNIEQMTFGAGNYYTFEEGRKYTVPIELARHLDAKGLLWQGGFR